MMYVLFVLCLVNTLFLVGIAGSLGKLLRAKETKEQLMYGDGFHRGRLAMLDTLLKNLERHKDIMPAWIIEWVENMMEAHIKLYGREVMSRDEEDLLDIPMSHIDYSNMLQKSSSDIKFIKDD